MKKIILITSAQAIKYHTKILVKVGGIPGIRDRNYWKWLHLEAPNQSLSTNA